MYIRHQQVPLTIKNSKRLTGAFQTVYFSPPAYSHRQQTVTLILCRALPPPRALAVSGNGHQKAKPVIRSCRYTYNNTRSRCRSPLHKWCLVGSSSPFMRLTEHLTVLCDRCKQRLSGWGKTDLLRLVIVGVQGSTTSCSHQGHIMATSWSRHGHIMVLRLQPCMIP